MSLSLYFVLPEAIALLILIYHCYRCRGLRETIYFFSAAFVYFSVKENLTALNLFQHGRYRFNDIQFPVFHAPLFVICGWVFAAYLSLSIAEGIVRRVKGESGEFFTILLTSLFVTSSIAYAVEVCGVTGGWWDWPYHRKVASPIDQARIVYGIYTPIYGWARFINGFLAPYLVFRHSKLAIKQGKLALLTFSYVLILGSLMTKFYNYQITGLLESGIIFGALFYQGWKVDWSKTVAEQRSWFSHYGITIASLLMLSVCWVVPIAAHAPLRVYVSTFAFTTFLLLYNRLLGFRSAVGLIIISYAINWIFGLPEVSFAFIQILLVTTFLALRKIIHNYMYLINKSPAVLSPRLLNCLFGIMGLVWLGIVIGLQKGEIIRTWIPDFGP